jgi:RNA polymerase sigma-70 factor (ECF subfamily)
MLIENEVRRNSNEKEHDAQKRDHAEPASDDEQPEHGAHNGQGQRQHEGRGAWPRDSLPGDSFRGTEGQGSRLEGFGREKKATQCGEWPPRIPTDFGVCCEQDSILTTYQRLKPFTFSETFFVKEKRGKGLLNAAEAFMSQADELIPTRQSLLSRLKDWDDSNSWQDFFDTYWRLIYKTASSAGLGAIEAEEVVQETLIRICRAIRQFEYDPKRGRFKAWLRTVTVSVIQERLRNQRHAYLKSAKAAAAWEQMRSDANLDENQIAKDWDSDWEDNLADAALERVKKRITPRHFQIFDLAVTKRWPTERIAETFQVSPAYIYLVKHRLSIRLQREVKKLRSESEKSTVSKQSWFAQCKSGGKAAARSSGA